MKNVIVLMIVVIFFAAVPCRAQKNPTKIQQDIQQTGQAIKTISSLFKKKKSGNVKDSTVAAGDINIGTDGNLPSPGNKIFAEPGGGLLCADSHGGTVLLNGLMYEWGDRTYGQQGNNQATKTYLPVQLTTDNDWKKVYTGGYYNLAIKTDGTLWSWGWGNTGELGLGNVYRINSPTRVGYDTTWVSVSGADGHAAGIRSDGTLWVWGSNVEGQLGVGPTLNSKVLTPMKLNNDQDWSKVAAGDGYTLALKRDGSLWAWGRNQAGALGTETKYETQQAPIRIGRDNDWVKIFTGTSGYASFGIKADGSLWAWGYNRSGQLGIGNVKGSSYPVQVGIDKDWVTVSNRTIRTIGIKADGSLWQWGENVKGIQRIDTRGKYIAAAEALNFMLVMRSDGTLWSSGNNSDGGLAYINNPNFNTIDFVHVTEFPAPVITTKPKAILASVLNDDARLLFKQSNSRLPILDKNKIAKVLNFKLSADKKQFILDAQSADYPFDVRVYATDMNKDGVEEVFVFYGNSFTSGRTGSSVILFMRDVHGDWHSYLGNEGIAVDVLTSGNSGYNDLAIGIPGFQYPIFGWNGSDYIRIKNISAAELSKGGHIDVEVLSRALNK